MFLPQLKKQPIDIAKIFEAYSIFSSNQNYQLRSGFFKKKIHTCDQHYISVIINVIRQILTYRTINGVAQIAKIQNIIEIKNIQNEHKDIKLGEYSKLLALRFLRETYFESNYLYMTYVHLYLASLLLKIALFKKESSDDERGKYIFHSDSKLFQDFGSKIKESGKIDKEIQVIGFSIHKITLEILHTSGTFIKYLPFHEQFLEGKEQTKKERFHNQMYTSFLKLKEENVKFPNKFHYFKENDVLKYTTFYQKVNLKDQIKKNYLELFDDIWRSIHYALSSENIQTTIVDAYLISFTQITKNFLNQKLMFCQSLVLETFDRHFWKHFNDFLEHKLAELKSCLEIGESLTEQQLKEILSIYLFILSFNYHLLQPQIMYMIQHRYIEELAQLFVVVLKFYVKLSEQRQTDTFKVNSKKKGTQHKPIEGNLTAINALKCMIYCMSKIKQLSVEFTHEFNFKQNTNHYYSLISLYSNIILQIEPVDNKKQPYSSLKMQTQGKIISKMGTNHDLHFKKHEFLFVFYEKQAQKNQGSSLTIQSFKRSVQRLLQKHKKFIVLVQMKEIKPLTEYITLQKEEMTKEELQILPNAMSQKSGMNRLSYRLNLNNSGLSIIPEVKSTFLARRSPIDGKVPSFVQSLKIKINKPNELLMKSLSSSRMQKRLNDSSSHFRSYRSNQHSDCSQSSLSLLKENAMPPFANPPQFKHVFINDYDLPLIQKSQEFLESSIRKSTIKMQQMSRLESNSNTKYFNNYIQQKRASEIKKKSEQEEEQFAQSKRLAEIRLSERKTKDFQRKIATEHIPNPSKMVKVNASAKTIQIPVGNLNQSLPNIKSSQLDISVNEKICFYFTPKVKKELLKKKVLIRKQSCLEMGMIANLQQDITTTEAGTVRRYMLSIKIYVTPLVPLSKISINVQLPNWLEFVSKYNLTRENVKEQSQFISTFNVELKSTREKILKRNYGDLPILTVVYERNDKKEIISQPLYILLNKFTIEKGLTESEFAEFTQENYRISEPIMIHEKIARSVKEIKQFFPNLCAFNLDPTEKIQLFSNMDQIASDSLGIIRLEFIKNHQEMLLLFFDNGAQSNSNLGRSKLYVELIPLKGQNWNYEQLHIFSTCLRSIFCTEQ